MSERINVNTKELIQFLENQLATEPEGAPDHAQYVLKVLGSYTYELERQLMRLKNELRLKTTYIKDMENTLSTVAKIMGTAPGNVETLIKKIQQCSDDAVRYLAVRHAHTNMKWNDCSACLPRVEEEKYVSFDGFNKSADSIIRSLIQIK